MSNAAKVPVLACARAYVRNGGVSFVQSYLKHSLVPLARIAAHLPDTGIIWDLGCGEGILTNLVARAKPRCQIVGFDRDSARIAVAAKNAAPNATFQVHDIFDLPQPQRIDGLIMNDVVHHQAFGRQPVLLAKALRLLRPGGAIVLKEVDRNDQADRRMTEFFDSRLYPDDELCFRTRADWLSLWGRLCVRDVVVDKVRHPWPASRTLLLATRPADADLFDEAGFIAETVAGNKKVDAATVTVFVTGATGFIGGHLARRLMKDGIVGKKVRLLALTRDPDRLPADLRAAGAIAVPGDLDDLPRLKNIFEGVDYVFHLAAEVKLTHGTDLWRNNYAGTVSLLAALEGRPLRRFVHASTMGAVDRAPTDPCTTPLDEGIAPNPLSEYGRTKLRAEEVVAASRLPYAILRVCWSYGSGMTPDTHVRFLTQGVADRKPFSFVDFPGKVSIVAVDDLVDALLLIAEREQASNQLYYVSDGRALSLGSLLRRAGSVIGRRAAFVRIPAPVSALARALRRFLPLQLQNLNSNVLWVDNSKIVTLGLQPKVTQRQGLANLAMDLELIPKSSHPLISIITGAASGIGLALAEALDAEGHRLLLIDSNSALSDVAVRLGAAHLVLDLTKAESIDTIDRFLSEHALQLDWVINCAGMGARGAVAEADAGREDMTVELNALALVRLSRLALRRFRAAGRGTLINIGSSAGFQPLPYMAAYAASKAFTQSFTRSLIGETRDRPGIHVMLANPSGTATGFQRAAGVKTRSGEQLMAPAEVAQRIVAAAYAGKPEVTIGRSGRAMQLAARLLPMRLQVRLWAKLMSSLR
jgi:nucleoside-diphosphate-sugar epimerase